MTMTVKELRDALAEYPDSMSVITEGCDCFGDAGSLEVLKNYDYEGNTPVDTLLISRASEKERLKMEREKEKREKEADEEAAAQRARGLIA